MKIKIELEHGETIGEADDKLEKALTAKYDDDSEKYADPVFNEFHEYLTKLHDELMQQIAIELKEILKYE